MAGTGTAHLRDSIDGHVGQGAQFDATLSPGDHTITATMHGVSADVNVSVA